MGNVISAAANEVTENASVSLPENDPTPITHDTWAFRKIKGRESGIFRDELAKLKKLVLTNLIRTTELPYAASKAIKKENLDTSVPKFPVASSPFPGDPIWYGPYETVDEYIKRQHNPGQRGLGFDTFIRYPFNKSVYCFLIRFTNDLKKLNIDLIRQMYHCLELKWASEGLINGENNGQIISFIAFDGEEIRMSIRGLREMYGYYNLKRLSYYKQDRFIITQFMELIGIMNLPSQEIIAGYFLDNDNGFHPEFTISSGLQRAVLKKPYIATIVGQTPDGQFLWEMMSGGRVQLAQTSNLLQIEPNLSDKQKLLEIEQPLQIESSTDLSFPGITNSDEFIKIIQEFFNYWKNVLGVNRNCTFFCYHCLYCF